MWKCNECGEDIEDQFEECWRCGAVVKREETPALGSTVVRQTDERATNPPRLLHTTGRAGFAIPDREVSYKYKFVQLPCCIDSQTVDHDSAIAEYLQAAVDRLAEQGWEFVRVDTVSLSTGKSPAASEGKSNSENQWYSVICFRRK